MSVTPSQKRCERKLAEIELLKQKDQHNDEELGKLSMEQYYKNVMTQHYQPTVKAYPVSPLTIGENSVMVQCNYNKNVYMFIHTGKKYVIGMPNIHTVLNVTCTFAAIRAADMRIDVATVNGQRDHNSETCTISYNYDNFDSIYYTSFARPDQCIIYSY
jgi:hypothetical protein